MYLTFRRSRWIAPAYAANDLVLTVLWAMASVENRSYISALVCFVVFFVNDLYGFINWGRIKERRNGDESPSHGVKKEFRSEKQAVDFP